MKKVVFIGGSSHSGSTMLDLMLSTNPSCFSAGEVKALFRPLKPHHKNPICGCGIKGCPVWSDIYEKGEIELYENIFNKYPGVNTIIDSSKNISWIYDQNRYLKNKGIKVVHLIIWKDPIELAVSLYKRNELNFFNKIWLNYHRNYLNLIPRAIAVKYKELAQNPSITLEKLCNVIDVDFTTGQHEYWHKTHHTLFGSASSRVHLHNPDSSEFTRLKTYIEKNQQKNGKREFNMKNYRTISYSLPDAEILPDHKLNIFESSSSINDIKEKLRSLDYAKHSGNIADKIIQKKIISLRVFKEKIKYLFMNMKKI